MKVVAFIADGRGLVFINPDHVVSVQESQTVGEGGSIQGTGKALITVTSQSITNGGGGSNEFRVPLSPADVVRALTDAPAPAMPAPPPAKQ